jgi:hypothetical protein
MMPNPVLQKTAAFLPPKNAKCYETDLVTAWMGEDGIFYVVSKDGDRTIENYDKVFEIYKLASLHGSHKLCMLANITKTGNMPRNVRAHLYAELPKYLKALALISESYTGRMLGNLFLLIKPSPYPARLFGNTGEASAWLGRYLKK